MSISCNLRDAAEISVVRFRDFGVSSFRFGNAQRHVTCREYLKTSRKPDRDEFEAARMSGNSRKMSQQSHLSELGGSFNTLDDRSPTPLLCQILDGFAIRASTSCVFFWAASVNRLFGVCLPLSIFSRRSA